MIGGPKAVVVVIFNAVGGRVFRVVQDTIRDQAKATMSFVDPLFDGIGLFKQCGGNNIQPARACIGKEINGGTVRHHGD